MINVVLENPQDQWISPQVPVCTLRPGVLDDTTSGYNANYQ